VLDPANPTCAPLANKGSHFTVDIEVGTPGQTFAVVADTGSDAIIVPSCICKESGSCNDNDRCFRGTNKSSTFLLKGFNNTQLQAKTPKHLPVVNMVFGSGPVQAVIASDVVNVAGIKASMSDGVLLMVNNQLRMNGPFEGILGLGQPKNETEIRRLQKEQEKEMASAAKKRQQAMAKMMKSANSSNRPQKGNKVGQGHGNFEDDLKAIDNIIKQAMAHGGGGMEDAIGSIAKQHPRGLQALAMSTDSHPFFDFLNPLLDPLSGLLTDVDGGDKQSPSFRKAISVHEDPSAEEASQSKGSQQIEQKPSDQGSDDQMDKAAGQPLTYKTKSFLQSAGINSFSLCFNDEGKSGALHLAPPKAKSALASVGTVHWGVDFQGISIGNTSVPAKFCSPTSKKDGQATACGGIPDSGTTLFMGPDDHIQMLFEGLCDSWKRCRTVASTGLQKKKAEIFQMLLEQCGSWMTEEKGLDELPSLHFKLADKTGKKQTLSLDAAGYIIEQNVQEMKVATKNILGMPMKVPVKTGNYSKVCAPAFGPMDMHTAKNGAVWILGSPLFYQYTVGYDLDKKNPSISFTKQSCGCSKDTSLVSGSIGKRKARQPRKLNGPPRVSHFDLSMGL
jgi:hypothetical protein